MKRFEDVTFDTGKLWLTVVIDGSITCILHWCGSMWICVPSIPVWPIWQYWWREGERMWSFLNELAAEEERDGGKVNNRWLKHVAAIRSSRRCASPPPASWEVTMQRRPWRHGVRDQVPPWWQPIMPDCHPHAVPDRASWDTHTERHTESLYSVKQCFLWLKFGSDDSGTFHAVSTLNPPASRDDTH